jgi:beta-lactamase regulating signal transducer with metallopeptidase domain/predicted  nucleic acid-binding Zn-ribbon protein
MTELPSLTDWTSFAGLLTLQATLLLATAWLAARALRRRPAAERHLVWAVAVAGVIVLPVFSTALPSWQLALPVPAWAGMEEVAAPSTPFSTPEEPPGAMAPLVATTDSVPGTAEASPAAGVASSVEERESAGPSVPLTVGALVLLLWLAGALMVATITLLSLLRVRAMAHRAQELRDPALVERATRIAAELGVRRPVHLLEGDTDLMPMTFGVLHASLLVPSSARTWSPERQEAVLRHELAHIRRRDTLTQLIADLGCALYWFHPLMWVAARYLRIEREHACDDVVLVSGARATDYAAELLEIARTMRAPRPTATAAIAMARPIRLRTRITAVLEDRRRTERLSGRLLVPFWTGALALITAISALAPAPAARDASPLPMTWNYALIDPVVATSPNPPPAPAELHGSESALARDAGQDQQHVALGYTDEPACWHNRDLAAGSMRVVNKDNGIITHHIVQHATSGMELCVRTNYSQPLREGDFQLAMLRPGDRQVLASRTPDSRQTLEIVRTDTGVEHTWFVDGVQRPFDETARQWRDVMLEVLSGYEAIDSIKGERGRLRGEIGRIRGEQGRLRGEIGRIRGEEGRLRGEIGRIRGQEARRHGETASIRGHEASMRGEIGSLRGRIASLQSARGATRDAETRARLDAEIEDVREEIRRVEARIAEYDASGRIGEVPRAEGLSEAAQARIREIERQIEALNTDSRVREIEARLAASDRSQEIGEIERRIEALDVDRRVREVEQRLEPQVRRLQELHRRIR